LIAVADQELGVLESFAEVAGLLHGPLTSGMCGYAAQVHPAGAVLDAYQDVQSFASASCALRLTGTSPGCRAPRSGCPLINNRRTLFPIVHIENLLAFAEDRTG
jgi:hypothetical protein